MPHSDIISIQLNKHLRFLSRRIKTILKENNGIIRILWTKTCFTLISHGTRQFMEGTKRFIGQFMLVIMFSSEMYSHRTFHYQSSVIKLIVKR